MLYPLVVLYDVNVNASQRQAVCRAIYLELKPFTKIFP